MFRAVALHAAVGGSAIAIGLAGILYLVTTPTASGWCGIYGAILVAAGNHLFQRAVRDELSS